MKVTIDVEVPSDVWMVKINLPEQEYCREYSETKLFWNLNDAKEYLLKEVDNMADSLRYTVNLCYDTFHVSYSHTDYEYSFIIVDKQKNEIARIDGYIRKEHISGTLA